ncbi:MAG: hypothetical protein PHY41_01205 [Candidatus Cloacimonetes bacterium]|nr:hypothetical protein [Candidatus Cloacimonadota bacterium]MDD3282087.1 hypothetical protein [Candidatus Cloacimonadota bacterium]
MISYYQDTRLEYRGGCHFKGSLEKLETSQRHIHLIAKRSCIQHSVCISGEICPQSGGSSE